MIKIYCRAGCADCIRSLEVLRISGVSFEYIDIDRDRQGEIFCLRSNKGKRITPTIVFPDGSILIEPSDDRLSLALEKYKKSIPDRIGNLDRVGFIGLGRMGEALVLNMLENGIDVVVYNRTREKTESLKKSYSYLVRDLGKTGIGRLTAAFSLKEFVSSLPVRKIIWLMVSQGKPVDEVIERLLEEDLGRGDIIIDGGNSFFEDSKRRYEFLKRQGVYYLDVGTSGGIEGARESPCMMAGGDRVAFDKVLPVLEKITGQGGSVEYFGPSGSGHFVKMVHNGIEYGMLQAIGEGFEVIYNSPYKIKLKDVALSYTKGSVIRGWLMDLLFRALGKDKRLDKIGGKVGGGTTGRWASQTAAKLKVKTPALDASLREREKSSGKDGFSGRVISALRFEFGRHEFDKKG